MEAVAPNILDAKLTAEMETKLDTIANGKVKRLDVLRPFLDEVVYKTMAKAGLSFDEDGKTKKGGVKSISPEETKKIEEVNAG